MRLLLCVGQKPCQLLFPLSFHGEYQIGGCLPSYGGLSHLFSSSANFQFNRIIALVSEYLRSCLRLEKGVYSEPLLGDIQYDPKEGLVLHVFPSSSVCEVLGGADKRCMRSHSKAEHEGV